VKRALIFEGRSIFVHVTYSHAAGGIAHCGGDSAVAHCGGELWWRQCGSSLWWRNFWVFRHPMSLLTTSSKVTASPIS
jgi:hypothetical protein